MLLYDQSYTFCCQHLHQESDREDISKIHRGSPSRLIPLHLAHGRIKSTLTPQGILSWVEHDHSLLEVCELVRSLGSFVKSVQVNSLVNPSTSTSSFEVPTSLAECPESGTIWSSSSGQTFFNSHAVLAYNHTFTSERWWWRGRVTEGTHRTHNIVSALNNDTRNVSAVMVQPKKWSTSRDTNIRISRHTSCQSPLSPRAAHHA